LLDGEKPVAGIYFERRLRKSSVVPMLLGSQADLNVLFDWFVIYAIKAFRWRKNRREDVLGSRDIKRGRALISVWLSEGGTFPDMETAHVRPNGFPPKSPRVTVK
jgi:hypothetical protein